jgi:hypothetical protein
MPVPKSKRAISLIAIPTTIPIAVCKILLGLASLEKPREVIHTVSESIGVR